MTTAHRPTWMAALGGGDGTRDGSSGIITRQVSSRDINAHTLLKLRQPGQNAPSDLLNNKQLFREAFERERLSREIYGNNVLPIEDSKEETVHNKGRKVAELNPDADVEFSDDVGKDPPDGIPSDEDEEVELLRELERIKKEREEEKLAVEAAKMQKTLSANPLMTHLSKSGDRVTLKRRWDEDVVFKNQTRDLDERPKKRFINDTIRSDFHRKFLDKYIK